MSYYSDSYRNMAVFSGAYLIVTLGIGLLMIIAQWRLFTKAGEPGWKCLIPFYGQYVWCRIVWSGKIFWTLFGVGFGAGILSSIVTSVTARSYSYGRSNGGAVLLMILMVAVAIVTLVIGIRMLIYTARAYGKSGGFAAGLFFLAPIFFCILAFGSSEYVGPMGIADGRQESRSQDTPDPGVPAVQSGWENAEVSAEARPGLIWIIIGICAVILCIGSVYRIAMAVTKFSLQGGVFGSEPIGSRNFEYVLSHRMFPEVVVNNLVFSFVTLVVSFLFSLLGGAAGKPGSRYGKAIAVACGAAIAFVPSFALEYILVSLRLTREFTLLIPLVQALPIGGVSMMLGALLPGIWPEHRSNGILIAPLLTLASFFFGRYTGNVLQNAMNTQRTEILSSYIYKMFFQSMNMSVAAAGEVLQSLMNLIPAVAGAVIIALLLKKARPVRTALMQKGAGIGVTAGVTAGGVVLLAGIVLISSYPSIFSNASVLHSVFASLISALLVAVLAFGAYLAVLLCAGKFDPQRWFPIAALILLSVGFNRYSGATYLIARDLGIVHTLIMPVLCAVANPLSIMLMLGMIMIRPQRFRTCALFALGAALLSAAYVIGDAKAYAIYNPARSEMNLGLLMQQAVHGLETMTENGTALRAGPEVLTGLFGVALMLVSIPLGAGTALCAHAAQRETEP